MTDASDDARTPRDANDAADTEQPDDMQVTANPWYASAQRDRAMTTLETHPDAATRARAAERVARWTAVLKGMFDGSLWIGSRTPVEETPAWATLEVIRGGFATGRLSAEGPLQPHETALLATLPRTAPEPDRAKLNRYYLSEDGRAALLAMLRDGTYRVNVPEEGALLAVAWLAEHGHTERARAVLDTIMPFAGRLRFYPLPAERPLTATDAVHRQDVADSTREIKDIKPPKNTPPAREAILQWAPLYDRVVALLSETVEGPMPSVRRAPDGTPERAANGHYVVEGGWPCQHYPDGWTERAEAVLRDYGKTRRTHQLCRKPDKPKRTFALMRRVLGQCVADPTMLTGREVGMVRSMLAGIEANRGLPGSERHTTLRATQRREVLAPVDADLAPVMVERLSRFAGDEGLPNLAPVETPVNEEESLSFGIARGTSLDRPRFRNAALRCVDAPLETLIGKGVIPSGETLARVVPQMSGAARAAAFHDPMLRTLYANMYRAFRRRRSLLLLNLQHQVQLSELPWVAAIEAVGRDDRADDSQRTLLRDLVRLTFDWWPHVIIPNKLLQELRALLDGAHLDIPLVDEVAADIFMGDFSAKYLRAAQLAAPRMRDTLYARYYGIDYAAVAQIDDLTLQPNGAATSHAFTSLCYERAGAQSGVWSSVATNGTVIEQEQILTTHNLAVLVDTLDLAPVLDASDLARRCWRWIMAQQGRALPNKYARLIMLKNCAYAWRQMVFWMSLLSEPSQNGLLLWIADDLAEQSPEVVQRWHPVLRGLERAAAGETLNLHATEPDARPFLGWTTGPHWLL